jgi:hypothetical protein
MTTRTIERLPASTAAQARLRIFQATRRPRRIEKIIVTSWGKIRVNGKLGQQHADVLEAIFSVGERPSSLPDGRIKILVDPARVRYVSNQMSGTTFKNVLDDLMQTLIEIIEPQELACIGHLIDHIDSAVMADGTQVTKRNPFGGERRMWKVEIGKAACKLVKADLWIFRNSERLSRLNHGISQAIARHVLTHSTEPRGGWTINGLIEAVCGADNLVGIRNRRRELMEDTEALCDLGIAIKDDRIHWS